MTDIYGSMTTDDQPKKKTALPKDFKVTDDHRKYATDRWNLPYLPDVFLEDFIECFDLNGRKHYDWNLTFKNFLRNSGPSGRFYNAIYWQNKCDQARRKEQPERKRAAPVYHPQQIVPRTDPMTAHSILAQMRRKLMA